MTNINKPLEALRRERDGTDATDAWNNALEAARDALEGVSVGGKVKPLVWVQCAGKTQFVAITKVGTFTVTWVPDMHVWNYDGRPFEHHDQAKAAAQADYERKIRSALEPGPTLAEAYRAGLEAAADACVDAAWKHEGSDAYSRGMDKGAFEQVKASSEAIRALPVPPEFGGE